MVSGNWDNAESAEADEEPPVWPAPEPVLVGYDKESEELLMIQPLEELEDDLDLRMSLLRKSVLSPNATVRHDLMSFRIKQTPDPQHDHQTSGCPRLRHAEINFGPGHDS